MRKLTNLLAILLIFTLSSHASIFRKLVLTKKITTVGIGFGAALSAFIGERALRNVRKQSLNAGINPKHTKDNTINFAMNGSEAATSRTEPKITYYNLNRINKFLMQM